MSADKRMAHNYEITQSIHIGEKEIVLGMDEGSEHPYFCAYYEYNELFGQYVDCMVGNDYAEMLGIYAQRIKTESENLKVERNSVTVPKEVITAELCYPNDYKKSIEGKVIVIRPEVLLPEYQTADRQLWLCTGGFGSYANSRGTACYCTNLYSGKECRWNRADVLGEMKELPEWAKDRLVVLLAQQSEKQKSIKEREER